MQQTFVTIPLTIEEMRQMWREDMRAELDNYTPPTIPNSPFPEYPTRKQTAEMLQVSYTTLNEWGKYTDDRPAVLVPLKVNGRVRYRLADIQRVLKESRRFKKQNAMEGQPA